MGDGVDLIPGENVVHERRVSNIANYEFCGVPIPQRNPVERSSRTMAFFVGVEEGQHHMAADITCSACYKNRHAVTRTRNRFAI